jgi:4-diphosphocytidyl-2-C-methyl-D-erythritol kinase
VSAVLLETAPAKINLTLQVLGRRADGYHELESLVAFADLADRLTLQPGENEGLEITGPFAGKSGIVADNLVLKALAAARERITGLKAGRFALEKIIPVAAGIGGGSADAAAALRLIARLNGISIEDLRLMSAALAVGADVPVCMSARSCVMRGVGEVLSEPLDLPPLPAILVNPGVALATRDVFTRLTLKPRERPSGNIPRGFDALIDYLKRNGNDLTSAASACAPAVEEVLDALQRLPAVKLARMSGSGATCFALFGSPGEAATAAQRLAAGKSWWVQETTLGSVRTTS